MAAPGSSQSDGTGSRREQLLALLTAGDPVAPLVQRVCEVSAAVLGVSGAGMCLVGGRAQEVVVHGTTRLAEELEDLQVTLGQGPCMQAVRTGSPTLVPRLVGHRTSSWPVYAEQAAARGVRAVFSFPLESGITTLGALDLYRDTEGPLTGTQLIDALILTALAAQALLAQRDRVFVDGSVSALHWISNGHPGSDPGPDGGVPTRRRAVDLGITVAQALAPLRTDAANDSLGATPELTRAADLGADRVAHLTAELASLDPVGRPGGAAGAHGSTRQVLVVDDEPGMRLVLGRALRRAGYRVLLADSTAAGIAQLVAHPDIDAMIADVAMPAAMGLDFTAAVVELHPGLPILFLTGGPTASGVLDDPLIGLVTKPVRVDDLRPQLAELIDRADQTATTTSVTTRSAPDRPARQAAAGGSAFIGQGGRRIEPGGHLGVLPELDQSTATWAAVVGLAGLTGDPAPSTDPASLGTAGLSAVPGAAASTGLASLGLFAAGVAHEVNNMIAVIAMRADLLTDGEDGQLLSSAAVDDITAITAAAARASGLAQQLMLFAGQRTIDRGLVDVAELVEDLRPRLDSVAGGAGIVAVTTEPVAAISGDHEHLERVVLNLVRNALEATALVPGAKAAVKPRVRVRVAPAGQAPARSEGPSAAAVVLEVTDHGKGMSDDVRARAVEPFFRAFTTSTGSGLGLSIVSGIVAQHGGRLDLTSTPGRGTTVRVTLPADPAGERPRPDVA